MSLLLSMVLLLKVNIYVSQSNNKLITIKNIDDSGFNTSSVSFIDDKYAEKYYLLEIGDILLTMTGNIGRCGIVDEENCYLNQRVLKLTCESKLYLYCFLLKYKNEIVNLGKGTAQLNLSLEDLKDIKIHNSCDDILLFKKNDFLFDELIKLKLKIRKLHALKANLLSKYF